MPLIGPMVVVAEGAAADLIETLTVAGAFPIVQTRWQGAATAIAEVKPVAVIIADPEPPASEAAVRDFLACIESWNGPWLPVIGRVRGDIGPAVPGAIPIGMDDTTERLVARVGYCLRVRSLYATAQRRMDAERADDRSLAFTGPDDPLNEATVLALGRGRAYPNLTVAIGERVRVLGAFSIENAARHLNARDIEGVIIGDGFPTRVVEALLTMIAEDPRYRTLPVGLFGSVARLVNDERLPNLVRDDGNVDRFVERIFPLIRNHAFAARLQRKLKSLDSNGMIDPKTGLMTEEAFEHQLGQVVTEIIENGGNLSVARFAFPHQSNQRARLEMVRNFSRLVRSTDFACWLDDGSILCAFNDTDLRTAHVVARQVASAVAQTLSASDVDRRLAVPTVTLATLKPTDDLSSLLSRIAADPAIAVG
jgi:GGDEF domain-containing protein